MCCDRYPGQNLLYGMRKGRRHAWATGLFAISQRTWRSFGKIALDPAIDRVALHTRMLGDDGNRLAFCDLGNRRPKAAIKSGLVRLRKRSQKASTIRPTERRRARSGCVHPDTSGSGRACRRTSGNLLRLLSHSLCACTTTSTARSRRHAPISAASATGVRAADLVNRKTWTATP
jgi:hypothetical protein